MKILIFSWRGPGHPMAGGAEQVTHEHAKAWVDSGHSVTLFTSMYPNAKKKDVVDGVNIVRKGKEVFGVQLMAFFWYIFGKHEKYDLVIDHFHGIPFFTPIYVRVNKFAVIHEVTKEVWAANPWRKPFNLIPEVVGNLLEPSMFKYIYKKTPFLTGAKSTLNDLVEWGIPSKSITIIHHGVKLEGAPKNLPKKSKRKTATFLGVLSKDKGIFDAIKVFNEINRKDDTWQFWVVGKGEKIMEEKIKKTVTKLGLSGKVKFFGFVSQKKKFELLAKSHVMVNPSMREGWGLVNIEANAMRTPVVAYNVAGNRDSIKNKKTGLLLKYGDYRGMAYEIIKLLGDEKRYLAMQNAAEKWSMSFTWDKSTRQSLEYIESI
jgi:glycosyltransferase involved in cell wall biosynthesis